MPSNRNARRGHDPITPIRSRIALLNASCDQLIRRDPATAMRHAAEAFELAREANDRGSIVSSSLRLGLCCRLISDYAGGLESLQRGLDLFDPREDDPVILVGLYRAFGQIHRDRGEYVKSLEAMSRSLELAEQCGDRPELASTLACMGDPYIRMGDYANALELFARVLAMQEELGDSYSVSLALNGIGDVYQKLGEWDYALEYYSRSLDISRRTGAEISEAVTLSNIGTVHMMEERFEQAAFHHQAALRGFTKLGRKVNMMVCRCNIANSYRKQRLFDEAIHNATASLEIADAIGSRFGRALASLCLGDIYLHRAEFALAIDHLERATTIASGMGDQRMLYDGYHELSHIYEKLGEEGKSLHYYKLCIEAKSALDNGTVRKAVAKMEISTQLEMLEREREEYRLKTSRLETEAERKSGELAAMALHLAQKSELIARIGERFRSIDPASFGSPEELLRQLQAYLREHGGSDDQWELFERHFQQTHSRFIHELSERYPTLTPMEVRICSLMRAGLSTKEIAGVLCTSTRTVEGHRRLIRLKTHLSRSENLGTFLAAIG